VQQESGAALLSFPCFSLPAPLWTSADYRQLTLNDNLNVRVG
jgi:hypothetical protein